MSRDRTGSGSQPEKPRPASTVILVRQGAGGPQIYLLKRNPQSGFFPGLYVFPGGAVGSQDCEPELWSIHADVPRSDLAERFGSAMDDGEILSCYVSAVRETFEEAGVFLGAMGQSARDRLEGARNGRGASNGLHRHWLRDEVFNGSCVLGLSILRPWSRWITPEGMPRRFDTRFFVAFMPLDQTCCPDGREMVHGVWMEPENALNCNLKGEIPLSPPTLVTLHQLLPYRCAGDFEAALRGRSWGDPLLPRLVSVSRGAMILEPWDPMYGREFEVGEDLESAVLPVGEAFSRIWYHKGMWRPVRVENTQGK